MYSDPVYNYVQEYQTLRLNYEKVNLTLSVVYIFAFFAYKGPILRFQFSFGGSKREEKD